MSRSLGGRGVGAANVEEPLFDLAGGNRAVAARSSGDASDDGVSTAMGGTRLSARAIRVPSRMASAIVEEPSVDLAAAAAARLRGLAESVERRRPIATHALSFGLADLSNPATAVAIDAGMKKVVTGEEKAIYEFSLRDPSGYEILREAFQHRPMHHEGDGRELRYSRLSKSAQPGALYVGSGRDLRTRVGQHLGRIGGPGTYSMRLGGWASSVEAIVDLRFWLYERDMDPIELEALEQELWDARTPLLGKRSGR